MAKATQTAPIRQMSTMAIGGIQVEEDITDTAATVLSLIGTETDAQLAVANVGFKISAYKADGSSRGALLYGFTSGSQLGYVPAGVPLDSLELPINNPANVYIKSASGTISDAVVEIYKIGEVV